MENSAPTDFHENYELGQCLGKGAYGTVFAVTSLASRKGMAVKVLALACSAKVQGPPEMPNAHALEQCQRELAAWSHVGQHQNVVCLEEVFVDHMFAYFVMDRCTQTLLQAWSRCTHLTEHTYAKHFRQMAGALEHIHSRGVAHRDIKHDNFLVGGPSRNTVMLCDFGMAAFVSKSVALIGSCGTLPYMAPEMVTPHATHGTASDIWSLGVMVYMAFFGAWPYSAKQRTKEATVKAIRDGSVLPPFSIGRRPGKEVVSGKALQFVRRLLTRDPFARPSAADCLSMEYLSHAHDPALRAQNTRCKARSLAPLLSAAIRACVFGVARQPADRCTADVLWEMQMRARVSVAVKSRVAALCKH